MIVLVHYAKKQWNPYEEKRMISLPILYKKAKTDKIQFWSISYERDGRIYTEHGQLDGKSQSAVKQVKQKNIGKKNETSLYSQACSEAESMWEKKEDKGYFKSIQEAENNIVFLPMLAHDMLKMTPKKVAKLWEKDFYTQPKMDGVRCLAYWVGNKIRLMSRGGKDYNVKHLQKILKDIIKPGQVLDGEIYIHGLMRQDIMALVKKHRDTEYEDTGKGSKDLELWVYDSFMIDKLNMPFHERLKMVVDLITTDKHIKSVATVNWEGDNYHTKSNFIDAHKGYVKAGFEGIIYRTFTGKYELGHRSRDLIKEKDFMDAEFKIVGVKDGDGKFEGCAIWICELANGDTVDVTPKGSLKQKKKWFQEADQHIGKLLTIKFQGYTKDDNLDIPVGLGFRELEDMDE